MDQAHIWNFSIIAHIDHGKSTLADRILELTHTVDPRLMRAQVLDSMDLERERGITIKAQAVRVFYDARDGETYPLHLIDPPGHVDFTYEVSRSLAACEGALLVVDASQGVEAQTVANTYLAVDAGLELIPCLNKIDLPGAEPERVAEEVSDLIGSEPGDILRISGKTGEGVTEVLEQLVRTVPPPKGDPDAPARAVIFDSEFDEYPDLRDALEKLSLNDAALAWEPETSDALGFGFRCGFLGLLHMDIVRERLEREYDLELLATMPSVAVEVTLTDGTELEVHSPSGMPDPAKIQEIREP